MKGVKSKDNINPCVSNKSFTYSSKSKQDVTEESALDVNDFVLDVIFQSMVGDCFAFKSKFCALSLNRTVSVRKDYASFLKVVSQMKKLKKLDVSGNKAGPVAFRAIIASLLKHDIVEELDISKNATDQDCSSMLGCYLSKSKCLHKLKLSGNLLGRSSLTRSLSSALTTNENLYHLDINSCGVTCLHQFFEGYRSILALKSPPLKYLDVSNNPSSNGEQLGIDISLVLEHQRCILQHLDISNVGLNGPGFRAITESLKNNHCLKELIAGGSKNKINCLSEVVEIITGGKNISKLDLKGIKNEEKERNENWAASFNFIHCPSQFNITELILSDTNLTSEFVLFLANKYPGKLASLKTLDFSYNPNLDLSAILKLKDLLTHDDNCRLSSLNLSGLKINDDLSLLISSYPELRFLFLDEVHLSNIGCDSSFQDAKTLLERVSFKRTRFSSLQNFYGILSFPLFANITDICLSGCSMSDTDLTFVLKLENILQLKRLDISNNKIKTGLSKLLLNSCSQEYACPCLESVDVARNCLDDKEAFAICEYISLTKSKRCLKTLNISNNNLTEKGIAALFNCSILKDGKLGLMNIDVSRQQFRMSEENFEIVVKILLNLTRLNEEHPLLKSNFSLLSQVKMNFSGLGDINSSLGKLLLKIPFVQNDLQQTVISTAGLNDYLLFAAGLDSACDGSECITECRNAASFSREKWTSIIGHNAPSWLNDSKERQNTIYTVGLPNDATKNEILKSFEKVVGLEIRAVSLIQNSVTQKFTGAAWILFKSQMAVDRAMAWYASCTAKVLNSPIQISTLPVSVLSANERTNLIQKQEKEERDLCKKQNKILKEKKLKRNPLTDDEFEMLIET